MALTVLHGALSDVGRKRQNNEDRYGIDTGLGLFVVCDGMGGGNAGEVASALAVATILAHFKESSNNPALPLVGDRDESFSLPANRLASAIRLANTAIHSSATDFAEWSGMGTTVVAAVIHDDMISFAHVGDSRLYLVRDGMIHSLTNDHSWVAEQIRRGILTEEEAERSPRRNIVTRALGVNAQVEVTLGETPLFDNDVFVLCSDGLTRGMQSSRILHILKETEDIPSASRRLIDHANDSGGEDNTTVIVLAIREPPLNGLWHRLYQRLAM